MGELLRAVLDAAPRMTVSAHDVADALRSRQPDLTPMQLHKLLYYVQGWHLAWAGKPLFEERIEAWTHGPVVARFWGDEKHGRQRPPARSLDANAVAIVEAVLTAHGHKSARQLRDETHDEDPWREVSENDDPAVFADPEITPAALRRFFEREPTLVELRAAEERHRLRADVHSLEPREPSEFVDAAIARARRGERVRDHRPA